LLPLIFIIFTSNIEEAFTETMTLTYADDTSASVMGKDPEALNEKKAEVMVFQKEKSRNIKVNHSEVQVAAETTWRHYKKGHEFVWACSSSETGHEVKNRSDKEALEKFDMRLNTQVL
jgi:hypothetical protein